MTHHHQLNSLAVYGSLAPGKPNHHQIETLDGTWTSGTVRGTLRQEGWGAELGFPGLILGEGQDIPVEVLTSDDLAAHWDRLDRFEGTAYRRVETTVRIAEGEVRAFIYCLADPDGSAGKA